MVVFHRLVGIKGSPVRFYLSRGIGYGSRNLTSSWRIFRWKVNFGHGREISDKIKTRNEHDLEKSRK